MVRVDEIVASAVGPTVAVAPESVEVSVKVAFDGSVIVSVPDPAAHASTAESVLAA
jgi:hypothetical protein